MSKGNVSDINAKLAFLTKKGVPKEFRNGPPLKLKRPLYLKNAVRHSRAGADTTVNAEGCSSQMSALLDCLQENEFMDAKCAKELEALVTCDRHFTKLKVAQKESMRSGEAVDGRPHASAINKMLKKYPNKVDKEGQIIQANLLTTLPSKHIKQVPHKNKRSPYPKYDNGLTVPEKNQDTR